MSGVYHPAGCRCQGCCLPSQYAARPARPSAPRAAQYRYAAPRRQQASSGSAGFWIVVALMVLYGLPAGIFHRGPAFIVAAAIWWPILTLFTILCLYGSYRQKHPQASRPKPPHVPLPPAAPPAKRNWLGFTAGDAPAPAAATACTHPAEQVVEVDNLLGGERWAWYCPGCDTQLPADWKPAPPVSPPAVPAPAPVAAAGRWHWDWRCTCGRTRSGYAATETAAQHAIERIIRVHHPHNHRYEYTWRNCA